jgi:2-C-methyl-D-erythritol 4-phosphate cytidylyltransferase
LEEVREVVVVVHPQDLDYCRARVIDPYGFTKVLRLVPGGRERQDSVYHGLQKMRQSDEMDLILVHDGARPFADAALVRRVLEGARKHGAAIPGIPVQDTLKRVDARGRVVETVDRQHLRQVQTPQGFQANLLHRAFAEAYARGLYGTDEASLVEALKLPVVVVPGSPFNLKITTPEDLLLAEALLPVVRKGS